MTLASTAWSAGNTYADLLSLFEQWQVFEHPPLREGVPDYTAESMARSLQQLKDFQGRLAAIDSTTWPVEQQVDYRLVWAEMNGLEFNIRVLQPWVRDPAFYASIFKAQSDTPAHEGPAHDAIIDLWTYDFPLAPASEARLTAQLRTIPPLLQQGRINLTGNAQELWLAGIKNIKDQAEELQGLAEQAQGAGAEFKQALAAALESTTLFAAWLEQQAPSKTGPSGVGKENYTWYLRNVNLVPLTWEEEVTILQRELARAHASLKLEELRNSELPPLVAIADAEEYNARFNAAITHYLEFLDAKHILPMADYMDPALRAQIGQFVPADERNFFAIAIHYDPTTLITHFYHWFDLARMQQEPHPSPVRGEALPYNMWVSRAEGMATSVEEMFMHAGLYDDNPRAREIVWIMLAQRAARGLGSLYAQANVFTLKQARDFHVEWTPRHWMRADLDLLGFEQQLYLRQPGYGSSYITGKYLLERLLKDRAHQQEDNFTVYGWFDEVNHAGLVPVSMIRWQLTGDSNEIQDIVSTYSDLALHAGQSVQ
ncbi:MAG: DUF885 family protein [Xanthomonadales bacterium]|nr:DUF885 family protein [Xanthomonadales bacterium]